MSKKVLSQHVRRSGSSALAALFGAWVQQVSSAQRIGWQDVAIGVGLAALWVLQQRQR